MARRSALKAHEASKFTEDVLKALAKDLQSGRLPLERTTVSDDKVIGLRAMVSKTGAISLHASYHLADRRPMMFLGELTDDKKNPDRITIEEARRLTEIVKALADEYGIDPQEGLHQRLRKELLRDGMKWRPK